MKRQGKKELEARMMYEKARREYHLAGEGYKNKKVSKTAYDKAKREYHAAGLRLAKVTSKKERE